MFLDGFVPTVQLMLTNQLKFQNFVIIVLSQYTYNIRSSVDDLWRVESRLVCRSLITQLITLLDILYNIVQIEADTIKKLTCW